MIPSIKTITMKTNPKICIIGAGVIGLSTGIQIQQTIHSAQVTIIADQFSPDTVSNVAAGFLRMPDFEQCADPAAKRKWSEMTWEHIQSLYMSPDAPNVGMQLITGFRLNENMPSPEKQTKYHAFREMSPQEKLMFPTYDKGFVQTTFILEGGKYLPWLTKKFAANGGKLVKHKLKSLQDIKGDYDVIVNCSGGGAKELVNDDTLIPIRGQIELVKAPWVKHFIFDTVKNIYMFPCQDYVVVGGTYQIYPEVTTPQPRSIDRARILSYAAKIMPGLKTAEIVGERVGFRPHRPAVRIETDILHDGAKQTPVVHNYGHGAYGIILHWGCAVDAAKLVEQCLVKAKL